MKVRSGIVGVFLLLADVVVAAPRPAERSAGSERDPLPPPAGLAPPRRATAKALINSGLTQNAMASIAAAVRRQIEPCAARFKSLGPGAERISVMLNLKLNKDGSLAVPPRVVRTKGADAKNGHYVAKVADMAVTVYRQCTPLRGLSADYYRTSRGGWSDFNMNFRLPKTASR